MAGSVRDATGAVRRMDMNATTPPSAHATAEISIAVLNPGPSGPPLAGWMPAAGGSPATAIRPAIHAIVLG